MIEIKYKWKNKFNIKTIKNNLPCEIEEGNIEYKLKIINPTNDRLRHLATQLNWRLNEGNGKAYYKLGVMDNGMEIGIQDNELEISLNHLKNICSMVHAKMKIVSIYQNKNSKNLYTMDIAIEKIKKYNNNNNIHQIRISVIGSMDSGKSTLIGVLTKKILDNGNGLARMHVLRHQHEIENGRTSSISLQSLGVKESGETFPLPNYSFDNKQNNKYYKIITFNDLAGKERYFKTTASGLTSQFPDYAIVVIEAFEGIQLMTKQHLSIVLALKVRLFFVLTKIDKVSIEMVEKRKFELESLLQMYENDGLLSYSNVRNVKNNEEAIHVANDMQIYRYKINYFPIFYVSNVSGKGLNLLNTCLANLFPLVKLKSLSANVSPEFFVSGFFKIETIGSVLFGIMKSGSIHIHDELLLGPDNLGNFIKITVQSIEVQRLPVKILSAGQTGTIAIKLNHDKDKNLTIRRGMILLDVKSKPKATFLFDAEVQMLQNQKNFNVNYEAVIHVGGIRQNVKIVKIISKKDLLCTCRMEFLRNPEFISPDLPLIFWKERTTAVGKVLRVIH